MLKAYYSDEWVTLYHGDMREVLPQLPQADCIITDCTYGETALEWDKWVEGWPTLAANALSRKGTMWCFGSFRMYLEHAREFMQQWHMVQDVVWEKQNGSSSHNDRFRRVHDHYVQWRHWTSKWRDVYHDDAVLQEPVGKRQRIHRQNRPVHWNAIGDGKYVSEDNGDRLLRSVQFMKNCHMQAINKTEKPVGLLYPLVRYSCPSGGLVVDPFAGSGSTLAAARQAGRRAIGIEKREEQCETAAKRLAESCELQLV